MDSVSTDKRSTKLDEGAIGRRNVNTITISSSSKFYDSARNLAEQLVQRGINVFTPRFEYDESLVEVTLDDKTRLTHEFLEKIRSSDAVYVIDEGGYTGRSVCIEVGFAFALHKIIVLCEPPAEDAIMALADAVIPIEQFLARFEA